MPAGSNSICSARRSSRPRSDRDALDAQLPRGGGPIAVRLQAAEKELAALEELTPLDGRRAAARQEAEAAARRADRGHGSGTGRAAPLAAGRCRGRVAGNDHAKAGPAAGRPRRPHRPVATPIGRPARGASPPAAGNGFAPGADRAACRRRRRAAAAKSEIRNQKSEIEIPDPLSLLRTWRTRPNRSRPRSPAARPSAAKRESSAPPRPSTRRQLAG